MTRANLRLSKPVEAYLLDADLLLSPQLSSQLQYEFGVSTVLCTCVMQANQKVASYELHVCQKAAAKDCLGESDWAALHGYPQLGLTVGRKVIERGFANATGGGAISGASALRFRCTSASLASGEPNNTAFLRSFSAHKMRPPPGYVRPSPPVPWGGCKVFNCTCKGMANYYGVGAPPSKSGWGCAPAPAQNWWVHEAKPCAQPGYSCCTTSDYTRHEAPFAGCGGSRH